MLSLEIKTVPYKLSLAVLDSDVGQGLACSSVEVLNMCFCSSNYLGLFHVRKEGCIGVEPYSNKQITTCRKVNYSPGPLQVGKEGNELEEMSSSSKDSEALSSVIHGSC